MGVEKRMSGEVQRVSLKGWSGMNLAADIGGDTRGQAVILLHGGGQTRHSWRGTMTALMASGYYVVSYDARGHGESDWAVDGDYSFDAMRDDLLAVIGTMPGPAILIGASMGGSTALIAIGESDATIARALVLVDIVPRADRDGVERVRAFMRANPDGFETLGAASAAVALYNPARQRPASPEGLSKNLRRSPDGRLRWHWDPRVFWGTPPVDLDELALRTTNASRLVRAPVLLVCGSTSDVVRREGAEDLLELIPQLRIVTVDNAGHMVAGDANDAFNAGIFNFLTDLGSLSGDDS